VLFGSNGNSHRVSKQLVVCVYTYIDIFFTIWRHW